MLDDFKYWRDSRPVQEIARPKLRWLGIALALFGMILWTLEDYWAIPTSRIIYQMTNLPPELIVSVVGIFPMACVFGATGLLLASWYKK